MSVEVHEKQENKRTTENNKTRGPTLSTSGKISRRSNIRNNGGGGANRDAEWQNEKWGEKRRAANRHGEPTFIDPV